MSTQALETQDPNAVGPTAEPRKASRSYNFEIEIFEKFGKTAIRWNLDPSYAIGDKDMVFLHEGPNKVQEMRVVSLANTWVTPHPWGSGLNASYMAWNFCTGSAGWRKLVSTLDT